MNTQSGSVSKYSLFLMEQLIVITIFALCASVCVKIFTESYIMASESKDLNFAIIEVENAAECFKAYSGDLDRLSRVLNVAKSQDGRSAAIYYDENWKQCDMEAAAYLLNLGLRDGVMDGGTLIFCDISAQTVEGKEITSISVAARRNGI